MEIKKIVIGSDHAGFGLKETVKAHLAGRGIEVVDMGTHAPESCNYVAASLKKGSRLLFIMYSTGVSLIPVISEKEFIVYY